MTQKIQSKKPEWISVERELPPSIKPVLIVVATTYAQRLVLRAVYAAPKTVPVGEETIDLAWGEYDEEMDETYCPEGWYEWNMNDETHWRVHDRVTHWMHLPDLPEDDVGHCANHSAQSDPVTT